jgi:hypothetical protein
MAARKRRAADQAVAGGNPTEFAMSWHAYGDESEPLPTYILAAAILETAAEDAARGSMTSLLQRGQAKVHWHDESAARRRKIISVIATTDAMHLVVVHAGAPAGRAERQRVPPATGTATRRGWRRATGPRGKGADSEPSRSCGTRSYEVHPPSLQPTPSRSCARPDRALALDRRRGRWRGGRSLGRARRLPQRDRACD